MTDRPTNAPHGLEDVVRAHSTVATGLGEWCCRCTPGEWRPTAYRSAHVAAAIREWLTSEAVVEAAAFGVAGDQKPCRKALAVNGGCVDAPCYCLSAARAALAAVAGVV